MKAQTISLLSNPAVKTPVFLCKILNLCAALVVEFLDESFVGPERPMIVFPKPGCLLWLAISYELNKLIMLVTVDQFPRLNIGRPRKIVQALLDWLDDAFQRCII